MAEYGRAMSLAELEEIAEKDVYRILRVTDLQRATAQSGSLICSRDLAAARDRNAVLSRAFLAAQEELKRRARTGSAPLAPLFAVGAVGAAVAGLIGILVGFALARRRLASVGGDLRPCDLRPRSARRASRGLV